MRAGVQAIACVLLMGVLLTSSGCIEVHLVKNAFYPEEGVPVYHVVEKVKMSHVFSTRIGNVSSIEHTSSRTADIKKDTHWMKVDISITMESLPVPLPPDVQRYIEVKITMPDGTVWYSETFNTTVNRSLEIMSPMPGDWLFNVVGVGYGSDIIQYHDAYSITARVEEVK